MKAEWRWRRGWSEAELERALDGLSGRARTFDEPEEQLTPERGWIRHHSSADIGAEPSGPPLPGGAFERARVLARDFEFSDPRIVVAHFDPDVPLAGRRMLLELRVLGLRYLTGTVVEAVRDEPLHNRTLFGFRYATLEGHLESGAEWFLVEKDHATGLVRFSIEAAWQPGEMPNWWTAVGFRLLARRYQRAWHRLAYLRLRRLLGAEGLPPLPRADRLVHEGRPLAAPPVGEVARHRPREVPEEHEERARPVLRPFVLGFATGLRSLLPLAALARSNLARVAAAGELAADKLPFVPSRTEPLPLAGRLVLGAFASARVSPRGGRLQGAAAGALGALAGAFAGRAFRRRRPGLAPALVEDALAAGLVRAALPG